jgi:hypothetical protein
MPTCTHSFPQTKAERISTKDMHDLSTSLHIAFPPLLGFSFKDSIQIVLIQTRRMWNHPQILLSNQHIAASSLCKRDVQTTLVLLHILVLNTFAKVLRRLESGAHGSTLPLDNKVLQVHAVQQATQLVMCPHFVNWTRIAGQAIIIIILQHPNNKSRVVEGNLDSV